MNDIDKTSIFIPRQRIVTGYYGFTMDDRVFIHPSVVSRMSVYPSVRISFPDDNLSKH